MRLAVLSDIHCNVQALRTVLRQIKVRGADAILVAGDLAVLEAGRLRVDHDLGAAIDAISTSSAIAYINQSEVGFGCRRRDRTAAIATRELGLDTILFGSSAANRGAIRLDAAAVALRDLERFQNDRLQPSTAV